MWGTIISMFQTTINVIEAQQISDMNLIEMQRCNFLKGKVAIWVTNHNYFKVSTTMYLKHNKRNNNLASIYEICEQLTGIF